MQNAVVEQVWRVTEPVISHLGLEIVDIEYCRERSGAVLRFFLDREGGVSLDELAPCSRRIGDVIDANELISGPYVLEVSSPGINRRLRRREHFERYIGKRIRVKTHQPIDGRKSFLGSLASVDADGVLVSAVDGDHRIPFSEIARANYEHKFPSTRRPKSFKGEAS